MGIHRMRVCPFIKACFYTNFKVWKLVPIVPPFSKIIRRNAIWTVRAALSTLHPIALLRTSRSLCKCCHKNCPTDCDEHEGVISCTVAFEEKLKILNCTQKWERQEKTWPLSLIETKWIFIPSDFRQSYLHSETGPVIWWSRVQALLTDNHWICSRLPRVQLLACALYTLCK